MTIQETPLKDLLLIEPQVFGDDRGFFYESYNADKLKEAGITTEFVQDNHSYSTPGVLRGIHFQLPANPVAKLVRCTRGKVWDVAVDLRKDSPTYLQWHAEELTPENKKMLYIPEGFGHAFFTIEEADFLYKCSTTYDPEVDAGIAWNDPAIGIEWPFDTEPVLSEKDSNAPTWEELGVEFPYNG